MWLRCGGQTERVTFDLDAYVERARRGPCFVCAFLDGTAGYEHQMVFEDDDAVAFLSRYPTLRGYCIVAPKRHVEGVVQDLDLPEYLHLQKVVHRVGRAVSRAVPTERLYVLSLGSQDGNAHVHWHVAPLPPGVPYERQQFHALMAENGVLDVTDAEQAALAAEIRRAL